MLCLYLQGALNALGFIDNRKVLGCIYHKMCHLGPKPGVSTLMHTSAGSSTQSTRSKLFLVDLVILVWIIFLSVLYVHKTPKMGDFLVLFGLCCV